MEATQELSNSGWRMFLGYAGSHPRTPGVISTRVGYSAARFPMQLIGIMATTAERSRSFSILES